MSKGKRHYAAFSFESSSENLQTIAAELAYDRADAWARSAPGTPYGGTAAVSAAPKAGTANDLFEPDATAPVKEAQS